MRTQHTQFIHLHRYMCVYCKSGNGLMQYYEKRNCSEILKIIMRKGNQSTEELNKFMKNHTR